MRTIGIIGGCSAVATVEYYKLINAGIQKRLGGVASGEIIISSMNFGEVFRLVSNDQWEEGAAYVNGKAKSLERAGADFIICVSNTWHKVADEFMKDVRLPLLHIVDPTGEKINKAGIKKVGLLGTKATMSGTFLMNRCTEKYGVEVIVPTSEEQGYIDTVIFTELSQFSFKPESKAGYLKIVDSLAEQGAQGMILGCTEIGLLISQADRPNLPIFDSMVLHAEAAVERMLEEQVSETWSTCI